MKGGADHIKIDPNFMPASFCAKQTNVVQPVDPRGCFVLNHDTPTALAHRSDYNTTDDLIRILKDPAHPLRGYLSRPKTRVFFALCFKVRHYLCFVESSHA
jgi:hypothetical protein